MGDATRIVSTQAKIAAVSGLADGDLSDWESSFVASLEERLEQSKGHIGLTERQLSALDRLYWKHFA